MTLAEEEALIRTAQAGDRGAFCSLAAAHGRSVYMLARSYCRNPEDAEDLSQEVWMRVWKALPGFRREAAFSTWLRHIAVNTFLSTRRNRPGPNQGPALEREAAEDHPMLATHHDEDRVLTSIMAARIRSALDCLSDQQRLMFLLKHQEGLTYEEIGAALGCSTGTVKKGVFRASRLVRERIVSARHPAPIQEIEP